MKYIFLIFKRKSYFKYGKLCQLSQVNYLPQWKLLESVMIFVDEDQMQLGHRYTTQLDVDFFQSNGVLKLNTETTRKT